MSWFATRASVLFVSLFLLARTCSGLGDPANTEWWESTLVYQIWPRAYQDSDGNGEGDLQGIISRLDYIEGLGVETICLNPIYPSPLVDSGYDVSHYKDIHPMFGDMSDFDELLEEIHNRDMKVILDVVPNHSSDQHEWFNASIYRIDPYTDYYVWANGTVIENGTKVPPNNWVSNWGNKENSAWTWNDERDQWYYHKYHESEPDLYLHNSDVRDEITSIFEFWLDKGVDGFRISGVPYFFEDPDLRDEPSISDPEYTFGLPENVEFLYHIRQVVDTWTESNNSTSKLLVAGSYDTDSNSLSYYGNDYGNVSGILPFNYRFIMDIDIAGGNASEIEAKIEEWLGLVPSNASTNWALSNHDHSRIASRVGLERLDAVQMLSMLLPGQAFTYYGDEIGMQDTPILWNETVDTMPYSQTPEGYVENSRDSVRTPMQWDDSNSSGFSANENTYLPVNDNYVDANVKEQLEDSRSHLNVYKNLAQLRKDPVFIHGDWEIESMNDDDILVLRRTLTGHPVYVVIINLANDEQRVNITELYPDLDDYLDVVVISSKDVTNRSSVPRNSVGLLPNTGLVLRGGGNDGNVTESIPYDNEVDEREEMENTTDYMEVTTVLDIEEYTSDGNGTETTIAPSNLTDVTTDSTTEEQLLSTTEIPSVITIRPVSTTPSSTAGTCYTTMKLELSIGFAIVILARAW